MRIAPADLAGVLQKRGIAPDALTTSKGAAQAILDAGGADAKKTAKLVRELDDASLAVVRTLLGAPSNNTPIASPKTGAKAGAAALRQLDQQLSASSRPLAAETARALYKPSLKTPPRSLERFLLHAGRLHDELSGPNAKLMLTDSKVAEGVRKHLFMLQGLARFYEERGPKKEMESALADIKKLEDTIGAFGYACDMQAAAKDKTLPAAARARLDEAVETARADLEKVLDDGWLPGKDGRSSSINDVVDTFARIDFGSPKEDRKFVKEKLAEICDEVAAIKTDTSDLEGGIHELRRQLRWLPITLIALDGLVALDEKAGGAFAALKDDPVAQSPFARLPTPAGVDKNPIELPWPLFLALSKAIGDLGKIKDRGQVIEGVAAAIDPEHGHAAAEKAVGDAGGLEHVHEDADKLIRELEASGLMKKLAQAFRA